MSRPPSDLLTLAVTAAQLVAPRRYGLVDVGFLYHRSKGCWFVDASLYCGGAFTEPLVRERAA